MNTLKQLSLDFTKRRNRINEVYQDDQSKKFIVETEEGREEFKTKSKAVVYLFAIKNGFEFA